MTVTVANTSNTNTFDYWRNRTNELAYAMSTKAVTVESDTATGNAGITGTFSANTIKIGNSTVNVSISSPNTTQQSNGQYYLNANGTWAALAVPVYNTTSQLTGTSVLEVDNYPMATYNVVEYMLSIVNNDANGHVATKLMTMHNFGDAFYTEYAQMQSNASYAGGILSANANSTHVRVYLTPSASNTTIKFMRFNV